MEVGVETAEARAAEAAMVAGKEAVAREEAREGMVEAMVAEAAMVV